MSSTSSSSMELFRPSEMTNFVTPAPLPPLTAPPPLALPGCTLADISFVRPINRGAHSIVHVVLHRQQQRYYALKVLSKERLAAAGEVECRAVLREKEALQALQPHPFIITLHATLHDTSRLCLLLDLGLGGDLRGMLLRQQRKRALAPNDRLRGALEEGHVRFYGGCLVLALSHLHARGYAYRDLKPENVLIDSSGFPMLCDFGSTVHVGKSGRATTLLGTWEYAAPEQLTGVGCTLACDWWSLGTLMLEALCGEVPFPSGDDNEPLAALAAVRAFGPDAPLLGGLSVDACELLTTTLLVHDEAERWAACTSAGSDVTTRGFFEGVDWHALAEKRVPPPHAPTILGAADTRNFWHACLDEPDAKRFGAGLKAADGDPCDGHAPAPAAMECYSPGRRLKRPRESDDDARACDAWWSGF